ncbi:MAG: rod-binding protein [Desulfobacteraceae bacterium]|jgi:flagellar protein FlgJ|nr:rod-binding protein [Desulfobacteraceae bacterium]
MADVNRMDMGAAMFQLRASGVDKTVTTAASRLRHDGQSDDELENVSRQFESLLLNFMIREMRATVPESTLFPPSMAETIFTDMMDEQIAGEMAQNGGIGISRMIFNQLKGLK